jgi:hypothetical protein
LTFQKYLNSELEELKKYYLDRGKQIHMAILEPDEFKKNYTTVDFEVPKSEQQKQFCEDYIKYRTTVSAYTLDDPYANEDDEKVLSEEASLVYAYKDNYKATGKNEKILDDAKKLKDKLIRYIEYLQKRKLFKDILSWAEWQRIQGLKEGIVKHKLAKELLSDEDLSNRRSWNVLVIFWEDPIYKLPCKSMIDRIVIDDDNKEITLIDIKTANTFKDFKDRCRDLGYFRQLSFYWFAIRWWTMNALNKNYDDYTAKTYIIGLKSVDDAEVRVYGINEQHLTEGLTDMRLVMEAISWHWENDKWEYSKEYYLGEGDEKL